MNERGFTIVELLIIMGIMAILLGIVTIGLTRIQRNTNLATAVEIFSADMKNQQLKAMSGASTSGTSGTQYGVYILPGATNTYMPFADSAYSSDCTGKFCVALDNTIAISVTPSTSNPIIFAQQTGEIGTAITIVVKNTSGEQRTIMMNKLGVITNITTP